MYRIFLVEDDHTLAALLQKNLEAWGYQVQCADNFQDILPQFTSFQPHLVLLDIMLPFFNGYHWCNQLRQRSNVPIIFLSSASDNMNIVLAMNVGGDDFIEKPFDINVLIAKVQALLRRTYQMTTAASVLEHGGIVLNLNDATLTWQEQKIELTKNEFKILQILMEHRGKIISRDTLMTRLWENDMYVEENTLTVNINRLRKKLNSIGLTDYIKTKTGSGYLIETDYTIPLSNQTSSNK